MILNDDETLRLYVEESLEHLADIENDLLAIEEAGADIDEEMVNKVFRAAHSVKGGAGFMGLENIKALSHEMENILGMIREREMVPNPEIINILLLASDALRGLLRNVSGSNEIDISEHIEGLIALTTSELPDKEKEDTSGTVDISFPGGKAVFTVDEHDISSARKEEKIIYLVEYDLIHDVHKKDKILLDILNKMEKSGIILDGKIDTEAVGTLDDDVTSMRIPFLILFATILEPDMINALFETDEKNIYELAEDATIRSIAQPSPSETQVHTPAQTLSLVEDPAAPMAGKGEEGEEKRTVDEQKEQSVSGTAGPETSLRVHVSLLDSLMNLAGELVLGRNQLLQAIALKDFPPIEATGQRIDLITSELQEAIMLTRMQPIGSVFNKFPRVVRDLSRKLGKEIQLIIEGENVGLDKTIIEAISDPLTHLVRNSVDHGIEIPDDRREAGKDMTGKILLKAYHEAGQVNIEITDDGKGMDSNKLTAVAISKGLITEEQARTMSGKEKVSLIFLPGFSTAKKLTDVSGRGVGLDVVKTNLDKLGGLVDIDSKIGERTTIKIKLPLTLAIIPSQIASTGGERYAIPQVNLEELLRIPADQVKDRIEKVGGAQVVRLRGNLLPLITLADVIGVERTCFDPDDKKMKKDRRENIADRRSRKSPLSAQSAERRGQSAGTDLESQSEIETDHRKNPDRRYHAASAVNIVVVSTGTFKYGLVVDKLHDSEEIVVKPLGRHLKHCKGYAGATIMGDGRVALILDVTGLARMAQLTSLEGTDRATQVAREKAMSGKDAQALLTFKNAEDEQFAVPLVLVERIEKIKRTDIEQVGGKKVIQYRGSSLPLFAVEEVANVKPLPEKEDLLVIIFILSGRNIGLLATPPVDAIEGFLDIDDTILKQPGIMGSAIIDDHTTLMVDIFGLVETLNPDWFAERETVQRSEGEAATILYAEDSNFFRNQVKGFLEDGGFNFIQAEDGMEAWNLIQDHAQDIDIVITDIEMPNLDGYGLTKKIKGDRRFSHLPVIALTSLAGEGDMARGKEVGIDEYQVKLDREKLMESIYNYLKGK